MKKKEESYETQLEKLEKIVTELEENENISIDALREKIAKAKEAYKACQQILHATEKAVEELKNEEF